MDASIGVYVIDRFTYYNLEFLEGVDQNSKKTIQELVNMLLGLWTMDYGLWTMVYGLWSMVYGLWSMVYGLWSMVYGLWSMVYGLWSMVYGQYSPVSWRTEEMIPLHLKFVVVASSRRIKLN